MRRVPLARASLVLALAATLAGCFGGDSNERESESETWWDQPAENVPPAPPVPEYTVVRGDTLYMIAFKRGLDWRELATWNRIAAPYTIYVGQQLKLGPEPPPGAVVAGTASPPPRAPEPAEQASEPAPADAHADGNDGGAVETYAVRETAPAQAAAAPPSAPSPSTPPASTAKSEPARTAPAQSTPESEGSLTRAIRGTSSPPPESTAKSAPKPEAPKAEAPPALAPPAKPEAPPGKPAQVASAAPAPAVAATGPAKNVAGTSWRWPAQGTLVGRFLPGDPARQGINVQGKPGGTVSAAADGEVVYSGNGLVGYGELIIVKHNNELLSAYGGSGKRLVAEGTKVRSGQPLAELAGNGIVHFEIRRSGKPVDPLEYLPGR